MKTKAMCPKREVRPVRSAATQEALDVIARIFWAEAIAEVRVLLGKRKKR
jgi:hypothetical protein